MVTLGTKALTVLCAAGMLFVTDAAKWPYGEYFEGDGTYYNMDDIGGGNCAMRDLDLDMYDDMIPVALNAEQYGSSEMCGACIKGEASGEGSGNTKLPKKFKAYVIDKCPECAYGDLDFSMGGDGRWDIRWKFINCPKGDNKFEPEFLFEGSNDYYWKIQPRGTRTPVKKLWVNNKKAERTQDNFFIIQPPSGEKYDGKEKVKTKTIKNRKYKTKIARD